MAVAIMFFATMIKSPKAFVIKPKYVGLLAFMGILMVLSSIALFESYKYLSAGIASTLLFFYPVMVAVIMAIFYKERLTKKSWACLITAFLGVVILSKNDDGGFISLLGLTLVMLSSLSYAIYLVYINRGPMKKINTGIYQQRSDEENQHLYHYFLCHLGRLSCYDSLLPSRWWVDASKNHTCMDKCHRTWLFPYRYLSHLHLSRHSPYR